MSALAIEGLVAGYGGAPVLVGVDLGVGDAERVGLFGPNGHGKTTLLRAISGLLAPSAGTVRLFDEEVSGHPTRDLVERGLVHIPQGNLLFPEMEVMETLRLGAYVTRSRPAAQRNLDKVLSLFPRLSDRRRQQLRTLSGGERQMVAIGVGLMCDPKLLLLDEPTLGLSPKLKDELCTAIGAIAAGGLPLLLVDQDIDFLTELTDRLVMFDHGRATLQLKSGEHLDRDLVMAHYFGQAQRQ
jgi:branched-chain amino acid transport system ATP-binding protein